MSWINCNCVDKALASLGTQNGDTYSVNESCLEILETILSKLATEDYALTYRRSIGMAENVRKDLIPLLINVKDTANIIDATKIIDTTIKILVILTFPIECLLFDNKELHMQCSDFEKHILFEMNRFLTNCKEAFTDNKSTKAVVDHMKYFLDRQTVLDNQQCESINSCLLLLTNVLDIPESNLTLQNSSLQNQIIWNLFTQSIDKIVLVLINSPKNNFWLAAIVKFLTLIYKDQHVGTLQRLLNMWLESETESSEDNESNTSSPNQGSAESSQINSDPTSDSSDNGQTTKIKTQQTLEKKQNVSMKNVNKVVCEQNRNIRLSGMKRNSNCSSTETDSGISSMDQSRRSSDSTEFCHSQQLHQQRTSLHDLTTVLRNSSANFTNFINKNDIQSEISDCEYVTKVEHQEYISTSSNDDDQPRPVHQKPHHMVHKIRVIRNCNNSVDKKELRRKKLVKRSKTNIIKMKGLIHHLPTKDDIANILKEFTVDFLLKGFGILVRDLLSSIASLNSPVDSTYLFWLVTYFLKFAVQLELDTEHLTTVLSYEVMSYLIFQGVYVCEELEKLEEFPKAGKEAYLRRLHLIITAIREFIQSVTTYQRMNNLSEENSRFLSALQTNVTSIEELKLLFILLLRQYDPELHSKQYLQDLIFTNHNLLLFLDHSFEKIELRNSYMMRHLREFATVDVMKQYGILLEDFKENGELINNCIFTMMHHIAGDLKNLPILFQPNILRIFAEIWNSDYDICEDWSDLIEYVIQKFIHAPPRNINCSDILSPLIHENPTVLNDSYSDRNFCFTRCAEWLKIKKANMLLDFYSQSPSADFAIKDIAKKYVENGMQNKTQITVIKELLDQNIINQKQYEEFMNSNDGDNKKREIDQRICSNDDFNKNIKDLVDFLTQSNEDECLKWVQKILLNTCVVKLALAYPDKFEGNTMKPSIYYYALLNLPIPLITWTTEQSNFVKNDPFIFLLHKLGFLIPSNTLTTFIRIPHYWSVSHTYEVAQHLGAIDHDFPSFLALLNFELSHLEEKYDSQKLIDTVPEHLYKAMENYQKSSSTLVTETPDIVRYVPLTTCSDDVPGELIIPMIKTCFELSRDMKHSTVMEIDDKTSHILDERIAYDSASDTESVASDLTRMCVSDEEDKKVTTAERSE